MKYLHTMLRISNVDASLLFFRDALGLRVLHTAPNPTSRFTLIYLAAPGDDRAQIELTHNWDPEPLGMSRNFGHIAYTVENIYATCERLQSWGVAIARPPRDGRMAFVRSPDGISVELLQSGGALMLTEPWRSMPNSGHW